MNASPDWHSFPSSEALAEALAAKVADVLASGLAECGSATLAVSGGSTPARFFDALSKRHLDWKNVVVTLVDERFVPPTSERSNERLARERLLQNEARLARFLPLYSDAASPDEAAGLADAGVALLGPTLDAVVLGMGTDGHTASFFPDVANLDALLDPHQPRRVVAAHAPSAGEPRLTLTLPVLTGARFLALHIEGQEKKAVLEAALAPDGDKPVSAIFQNATRSVPVYWAG